MTISPISSVPSQNGGSKTLSASQLNMEQFLVLLTVQLSTQNPLEPMSDRDFFAQLAQLGTVQGLDSVNTTLEASQTASLIGKTVSAIRPYSESTSGLNEIVEGKVERVSFTNGEYLIHVKEANGGIAQIRADQIQTISA